MYVLRQGADRLWGLSVQDFDFPRLWTSGYRNYPQEAIPRLAFIRDAQAAGLTLAEIRSVPAIRDGGQAAPASTSPT
ncbi:MerR family DNA-binding protein [Nonomuraea sp. NPDC059194]|uniref:MerR family DNA-binding protein n=1 Tax=Nonomuraea sp. NPDC059194 TaxID=3346764 RepID=UPI0036805D9F